MANLTHIILSPLRPPYTERTVVSLMGALCVN